MADKYTDWRVHTPNTDGSLSIPAPKPNQPSDEWINAREADDKPLKPNEVSLESIERAGSQSGYAGGVNGVELKNNQPPMESVQRQGGIDLGAASNIVYDAPEPLQQHPANTVDEHHENENHHVEEFHGDHETYHETHS